MYHMKFNTLDFTYKSIRFFNVKDYKNLLVFYYIESHMIHASARFIMNIFIMKLMKCMLINIFITIRRKYENLFSLIFGIFLRRTQILI